MGSAIVKIRDWILGLPATLWAVLGLALALRLHQINETSIWFDEAFSIFAVQSSFTGMLDTVIREAIVPPLYYSALYLWTALFGQSEFAVRSLSLVFGMASVFMMYVTASLIYSRPIGLIAAFLLATATFHIFYSQETRMYALLTLLALVSFYGLLRLKADQSFAEVLIYGGGTVLMLYTHIFGVFFVLTQNLYYLILLLLKSPNRPPLRQWIALQSAIVALYTPWLWVFFAGKDEIAGADFWLQAPDLQSIVNLFSSFVGSEIGLALAAVVLVSFGLLKIAKMPGRGLVWARIFEREGFLVLWLFVPIVVSGLYSLFVQPILHPRYVIAASLPIYILSAAVIYEIASRSRSMTQIAVLIVACLTTYQLYAFYDDSTRTNVLRKKDDWRSLASYVIDRRSSGERVICQLPVCLPLRYYMVESGFKFNNFPELARSDPQFERKFRRLAERTADDEIIWFVNGENIDSEGIALDYFNTNYELIKKTEFYNRLIVHKFKKRTHVDRDLSELSSDEP